MTDKKRRQIKLPSSSAKPEARSIAEEAAWAGGGRVPGGVYKDPKNPARFHRKGRGGTPSRVVRRITVYVADELVVNLDMYRATSDQNLSRSDVVELALRRFLSELVDQ